MVQPSSSISIIQDPRLTVPPVPEASEDDANAAVAAAKAAFPAWSELDPAVRGSYLKKLAALIRFLNDILLSAPSILIGLFVYTLMVRPMGTYSGWAGGVALAIIATPATGGRTAQRQS